MNSSVFVLVLASYGVASWINAILMSRWFNLTDPRTYGSGNPGAANVLRSGHLFFAAVVFIVDFLKGFVPVWIATQLALTPFCIGMVATAACLGHIYPIFFHFQGGKGVATAFGAITVMSWICSGLLLSTWLLVFCSTGYSALCAIVCALLAPCYFYYFGSHFNEVVMILSVLVLMRHWPNMKRLYRGQELVIMRFNQGKRKGHNKRFPL